MIKKLGKYNATIETERANGLALSWGEDFAAVAERIVGIHLHGPRVTDEVVDSLTRDPALLYYLRLLDLADSKVTDRGMRRLFLLGSLERLNLRATSITGRGVKAVCQLPGLQVLDVRETALRWATRIRLRWSFSGLQVIVCRPRAESWTVSCGLFTR